MHEESKLSRSPVHLIPLETCCLMVYQHCSLLKGADEGPTTSPYCCPGSSTCCTDISRARSSCASDVRGLPRVVQGTIQLPHNSPDPRGVAKMEYANRVARWES